MLYVTHVFSCLKTMWYVTHVLCPFKTEWYQHLLRSTISSKPQKSSYFPVGEFKKLFSYPDFSGWVLSKVWWVKNNRIEIKINFREILSTRFSSGVSIVSLCPDWIFMSSRSVHLLSISRVFSVFSVKNFVRNSEFTKLRWKPMFVADSYPVAI